MNYVFKKLIILICTYIFLFKKKDLYINLIKDQFCIYLIS